jgi:hypothetical protein
MVHPGPFCRELGFATKRLTFGMARDGLVSEGATFDPIGGFERSIVRRWLERMDQAFAPIASWLP